MDPKIWSRLPRELLFPIIKYANRDFNTMKERDALWAKWLEIARGDRCLKGAILAQQWGEVWFSWHELRLSPDEELVNDCDDRSIEDYAKRCDNLKVRLHRNEGAELIHELLEWDRGICPAQYVSILHLLFQASREEWAEYLPPSHRTIQYSMRMVIPVMERVKQINLKGPRSDTIFELIGQLHQLQSLSVGSPWCDYEFRKAHTDGDLDTYDWMKLSQLTHLKELTIYQLSEAEAITLAQLVVRLPLLEIFCVGTYRREWLQDLRQDPTTTPLQSLIYPDSTDEDHSVLHSNLLINLPTTLSKLELKDHHFFGQSALQIPDADRTTDQHLSRCYLKVLFTELDDLRCTRNLLTWLPNACLEKISFSPVISCNSDSSDRLSTPLRLTNEIVSAHQETLQEIVLSNIWRADLSFASCFTKEWSHRFKLTDLVLGTDCVPSKDCTKAHEQLVPQSLKHVLFGCEEDPKRWGPDIERIRLELPWSVHDIDFTAPDLWQWPSMQNLRVLIISPRNKCGEAGHTLDHHVEIAVALYQNATASLRCIQLCDYRFWVDYDDAGDSYIVDWLSACHGTSDIRSEAENERTKRDVRAWLKPEDEKFILPDSDLNQGRSAYNSRWRMQGSTAERFFLQGFNFMIARRCAL